MIANDPGVRAEVMAPMIAGARARGIADAYEMMGEAAVLLDFSGTVLHASKDAEALMGCALAVTGGHVVAVDRKSAPALQRLLEAGLADTGPMRLEEDLLCAEDGMRQRVRLYRVPSAGEAYQLLSAVLVLEPPRRVRRRPAPRTTRTTRAAA
ncbi:MAG TPA: hypothetical protein VIL72_09960 [Beijerinckiaceae bacterium]